MTFQFPRTFGTRKFRAGPDLRGANALVIRELRVRRLDDVRRIRAWLDDERNLHSLFAVLRDADGRRVLDAGHGIHDALDVFGEDVEPFRRDDHFLLAAADEEAPRLVELADIAGVEPSIFECRARRVGRAVSTPS